MIYYARITGRSNRDTTLTRFIACGADPDMIILDDTPHQKQTNSLYFDVKARLLKGDRRLFIDTLSSLGKNKREISKELDWLKEYEIRLIVLDLPSTRKSQATPLDVISDLYHLLAEEEILNVKTKQHEAYVQAKADGRRFGRSRIPYPENWKVNYQRWKNNEITAIEFMRITNLKKGTFYNLVKEYEANKLLDICHLDGKVD